MRELPAKAFVNALRLGEIDLSYNQISSMPPNVFVDETDYILPPANGENPLLPRFGLRTIRLNNNNLTFVDPRWFRNLRNLETITLNNNFLTEIDLNSAFGNSLALRSIELQNNSFSISNSSGFEKELNLFYISNNPKINGTEPIKIHAKELRIENTNLQRCYISSNTVILRANINRISSVIVEEVPNTILQELYLAHNEIVTADFLVGFEN